MSNLAKSILAGVVLSLLAGGLIYLLGSGTVYPFCEKDIVQGAVGSHTFTSPYTTLETLTSVKTCIGTGSSQTCTTTTTSGPVYHAGTYSLLIRYNDQLHKRDIDPSLYASMKDGDPVNFDICKAK